MLCVITTIRLQSTMWTDPITRVENLSKSTKWTKTNPQSGWTSQRVKTTVRNEDGPNDKGRKITKSTKWTNPTKGQDSSHKVDGVYKGSRLVHNVDGPNKGRKT